MAKPFGMSLRILQLLLGKGIGTPSAKKNYRTAEGRVARSVEYNVEDIWMLRLRVRHITPELADDVLLCLVIVIRCRGRGGPQRAQPYPAARLRASANQHRHVCDFGVQRQQLHDAP